MRCPSLPEVRTLFLVIIGAILLWLLETSPATAALWYPTAQASQGQETQYIDLDSVQPLGRGHVRVESAYEDQRSGTLQRTAYLTEYNCRTRTFRDLQRNGRIAQLRWYPVDPDPLNAATLDYVCAVIEKQSRPD